MAKNTKSLLHFNSNLTNSKNRNFDIIGNPQISNTISKFGNSSIYFDGNSRVVNDIADMDISIGDFWAISTFYPEKDDNKGCNQVVVNTPKGKDFIDSLDLSQFDAFPITLAESYIGNTNYIKSSPQHPNRSLFWKMIKNGYSVDDSVKRSLYYNNSLKGFIKFNLYKIWKKLR